MGKEIKLEYEKNNNNINMTQRSIKPCGYCYVFIYLILETISDAMLRVTWRNVKLIVRSSVTKQTTLMMQNHVLEPLKITRLVLNGTFFIICAGMGRLNFFSRATV